MLEEESQAHTSSNKNAFANSSPSGKHAMQCNASLKFELKQIKRPLLFLLQ